MTEAYDCDPAPKPDLVATPADNPDAAKSEEVPLSLKGQVVSLAPVDKEQLPQRPWLIEGVFMRGNVTMIVGRGGAGKSLLALQLGIAVASGKEFAGWKPRYRTNVLALNAEDDLDEQRRRMLSACSTMGVQEVEIADRLLTLRDRKNMVLCYRDLDTKKIKDSQLYRALKSLVREREIGLVTLDPFVETHAYLDENSNTDMREVIQMLRRIARECNIAVLIVHHTRKGMIGGDQDAARGGSALVNACRVVLTVEGMTSEQAKQLSAEQSAEYWRYIRITGVKSNYGERGGEKWLKIRSVALRNGGADPGDFSPGLEATTIGEAPPTIEAWPHLHELLIAIKKGHGTKGEAWSAATRGSLETRLDGFILRQFGLSASNAKAIIQQCVEGGLIEVREASASNRHKYKGYFLRDQPRQRDLALEDDAPPF